MKLTAHDLAQVRKPLPEIPQRQYNKTVEDVLWRITLVREAMEASSMRQIELAKHLGITIVQVNRWLHGVRTVPDHWLYPMAKLVDGEDA